MKKQGLLNFFSSAVALRLGGNCSRPPQYPRPQLWDETAGLPPSSNN